MRILLIRPPAVAFGREPALILNEPLGLLYLAGYLKKNKKDVAVIDGCANDFKISVHCLSARFFQFQKDMVIAA